MRTRRGKAAIDKLGECYVYRGASAEEAEKVIEAGHALPQDPSSLIGNDLDILECFFEELRGAPSGKVERMLQRRVPRWATRQGVNLTPDFDSALGYAQNRPGGKVLIFDISDLGSDEVFQLGESYIQAKHPEKVRLVGVYDVSSGRLLAIRGGEPVRRRYKGGENATRGSR